MDGIDPNIVTTAESVAAEVPGVRHAHARARWTGRILRVEVEGWVDAETSVAEADRLGQYVADQLTTRLPEMRSFTWTARGV
jgi:divalent metal cation (Fe/Co/Zn/Cd) transporter